MNRNTTSVLAVFRTDAASFTTSWDKTANMNISRIWLFLFPCTPKWGTCPLAFYGCVAIRQRGHISYNDAPHRQFPVLHRIEFPRRVAAALRATVVCRPRRPSVLQSDLSSATAPKVRRPATLGLQGGGCWPPATWREIAYWFYVTATWPTRHH